MDRELKNLTLNISQLAALTTQRKAWDVLSDFCSAMRCMPVWNGQTLTFVQDRPSDKVWTYNRSNVVMPDDGAPFRYSFSALKDRHNAVEVNWIDPNNGWETATELVEDTQAIARYGRNVTKMDAFGCTSRGQAHRAGLWLIKTELLETQTVDFSVGAEGLRHVPGDVIEICDDDYAGIRTGGRVLAVNSQTRTLTLDREITLPSSGTTLISLVDGSGNPVSVEVQSVTDGVKVKVSRVPDGVAGYSVWGLKLPTLRQRLFRCVSIRENDDGTYAITAVQHVPEKEAIVDNGAHFDGDQSGTVNGVTPPAVQHLTAEVTADSGEYQVLARWDTPKVVKGVSFLLRLTVAADDGSERLVSTARTTETTYRFRQLALGNYRLTVRAVNAWGQQGDPASVSFRIAAPAAPSRIELTPGYFQITATPHLAVYDPTVQFEFWFSEKRITDIRQVETTARYLGTALYWIAASINIKPGHDYYFYVRSVNTVGKSAFVEAVGQPSDDASGYLDFFKGEIGKTHLAQELWTQIDNGQLAPDLAEIRTSITDVSNEITQTVNKKLEDQSAAIQQIQKVQVDTNNNLNSMWAVKLQQMQDGRLYIAGNAKGFPSIASGESSLTGFISQVDGTPAYTGVFQGWTTRSLYTYRWSPTTGPQWTRHARKNEVDRLDQWNSETWLYNHDKSMRLGLTGSTWGCYSDTQKKWIPLDVSHGGTGANSLDDAKTNLQIPEGGLTKAMTLNAPGGAVDGKYYPVIIDTSAMNGSGAMLCPVEIKTAGGPASNPLNSNSFFGFIRCGGWSDVRDVAYGSFVCYEKNELGILCIKASQRDYAQHVAFYIHKSAFPVVVQTGYKAKVKVPTEDYVIGDNGVKGR